MEEAHLIERGFYEASITLKKPPTQEDVVLDSPEKVVALFGFIASSVQERLIVVCVDSHAKLMAYTTVAIGNVHGVPLEPVDVARLPIMLGAPRIFILHNHTSRSVEPSTEDDGATMRCAAACNLLGIKLEDHLIVGTDGFYSYRASNDSMLKRVPRLAEEEK